MRRVPAIWRVPAVSCLVTMFWTAPAVVAQHTPGAFQLLERVRTTYAAIGSYHDLGEIERTTNVDGSERTLLSFFEIAVAENGRFLWRIHGETPIGFEECMVWNDGRSSFAFSSLYGQYMPIPSVAAEVVHGFGQGGYEALIVPLLLAGADDALDDPPGAAVEGPEACGEASCWVLFLSRLAGAIKAWIWIDQATSLIREVVVELETSPGSVSSGVPSSSALIRTGPTKIRVRHHPARGIPMAFEAPAEATLVDRWHSAPREQPASDDPWLGFREEITVSLLTVVARIVDSQGEPVLGLKPQDLAVRVGDEELSVSSLDWLSSGREVAEVASAEPPRPGALFSTDAVPSTETGRLVVLFLQVDLEPSRIKGHLKILPDVAELVRSLHPDDRVAVVSFDAHLKLWQDFSRDRDATREALVKAIGHGSPVRPRGRDASLAEFFDFRAGKAATSPERALQLTAEALTPLPGEKDLIYLGWGLGRFDGRSVTMTTDYGPAVRALDAARTTVFVLDVTQADRHSLEVGLESVARHTGGTYSRTFHFSSQAVRRLARTISGHYVVTIDRSARPQARGRLKISLREKQGRVLFKPLILG